MITGFKPIPGQTIKLVTDDGQYVNIDTIDALGWCLLSFDDPRIRRIMEALELDKMSSCKFIQQAVESYCFSIEHSALFPELHDHLTRGVGDN